MDLSRVNRGEWIAILGGLLLVLSVFLPWYSLEKNGVVGDIKGPADLTGWEAHPTMRYLLVAAAIAPLILAWIVANDHALSWPRGEVTMVVAIAAFGLVGYAGVIDRPGDSQSLISLKWGWFLAILGPILMLAGAISRTNEAGGRTRKPPGTL